MFLNVGVEVSRALVTMRSVRERELARFLTISRAWRRGHGSSGGGGWQVGFLGRKCLGDDDGVFEELWFWEILGLGSVVCKMTSQSRIAQQALTELEKSSGELDAQLAEAAKFLGFGTDDISRQLHRLEGVKESTTRSGGHGKEEWLLKWLLKRLQAPKDNGPRQTEGFWNLLLVTMRRLPLNISARALGERKVVAIIQQTLDELKQKPTTEKSASTSAPDETDGSKKSKKRKRQEVVVDTASISVFFGSPLLRSILAVVDLMVNPTYQQTRDGRGTEFSVEYMRSILRVKSEEAATLFGNWLSLLEKYEVDFGSQIDWISPFAEIWQLHLTDENYLTHFSLNCTLPLLSIKTHLPAGAGNAVAQVEQLIARNVIIPTRAAQLENAESTQFADLTKLAVIMEPLNASTLFEVAIRSIQPQGTKRRRPVDETWLQKAYASLIEALPRKKVEQNSIAVCSMLQVAIMHKVSLELDSLRSTLSEFALPELGETNWGLVASMIELDANVFLIPGVDKDLLTDLLSRITQASILSDNEDTLDEIVRNVIVPLMREFANARDLIGFIHHWFAQLLLVERAFQKGRSNASQRLRGWHDEALHKALQALLQSSLSTQQVTQLFDWLSEKPVGEIASVLVILQAISISISQEEFVDTVGLRTYHIMSQDRRLTKLDDQSLHRVWAILSNTLRVTSIASRQEMESLWSNGETPFTLLHESRLSGPSISSLPSYLLVIWEFVCVACDVAKKGTALFTLANKALHQILDKIGHDVKDLVTKSRNNNETDLLGDHPHGSDANNVKVALSCIQALLRSHPKALVSAVEERSFKTTLTSIFWLASASEEGPILKAHPIGKELPKSWMSALQQDCVLNDVTTRDLMIGIMINDVEKPMNPFSNNQTRNILALKSLLQLSPTTIHRKYRERLMQAWIPSTALDVKSSNWTSSAVLALKLRVMRFPMFYEGMQFKHLDSVGGAVEISDDHELGTNLRLFEELVRLTFEFVFSNVEQTRSQDYIKDAIKFISKANKAAKKESASLSNASLILYKLILRLIRIHSDTIVKAGLLTEKELNKAGARLIDAIVSEAQRILLSFSQFEATDTVANLLLVIILDVVDEIGNADAKVDIRTSCQALLQNDAVIRNNDTRARVQHFVASSSDNGPTQDSSRPPSHDCSSIDGRKAIQQQVRSVLAGLDENARLGVVKNALSYADNENLGLGQLLAIREMITHLKNIRKPKLRRDDDDSDDSSDDEDNTIEALDISEVHSILCRQLPKAQGVRQFSLLCEIMTLILRTKARSITQWNIDSTIGAISMICSRYGPRLRLQRASTVYLHVCQLIQTILQSHRLKLEGHFHIVVQALQALLRCLFIPLPHSSSKILKTYAPPAWLPTTPSEQSLNAIHAAAFTRLVTLICDPSVSSVTRAKHNALTSATDKAKRMAGQHMVFVLVSYIRLQLDMKMLPGMREKMTPGVYAIFDTTTVELRRAVTEGMDASGRAVFGALYRDYLKFGKWKGA